MIFARALDMFWLIEPNFPDAASKLVHEPLGVFAYLTVPVAVVAVLGGVLPPPADEAS